MTEPTAWALYNSRNPEFNEVEFAYPHREPITEGDKRAGWTATPLYTLEEGAAEERAKIVAWIERRYASTISENIVQGIEAKEHLK